MATSGPSSVVMASSTASYMTEGRSQYYIRSIRIRVHVLLDIECTQRNSHPMATSGPSSADTVSSIASYMTEGRYRHVRILLWRLCGRVFLSKVDTQTTSPHPPMREQHHTLSMRFTRVDVLYVLVCWQVHVDRRLPQHGAELGTAMPRYSTTHIIA